MKCMAFEQERLLRIGPAPPGAASVPPAWQRCSSRRMVGARLDGHCRREPRLYSPTGCAAALAAVETMRGGKARSFARLGSCGMMFGSSMSSVAGFSSFSAGGLSAAVAES